MKTIKDFSCFADFRSYLLNEAEKSDWPFRFEFKNVVIALSNPTLIGILYNLCPSRDRKTYALVFEKLSLYGVYVSLTSVTVRYID